MNNSANNATRDALQRLQDDGTDLTKMIEIDFFIVIPSEKVGALVMNEVQKTFPNAVLDIDTDEDELYITCKIAMIPDYHDVVKTETSLDDIAKPHGGYMDGFGSYGNE